MRDKKQQLGQLVSALLGVIAIVVMLAPASRAMSDDEDLSYPCPQACLNWTPSDWQWWAMGCVPPCKKRDDSENNAARPAATPRPRHQFVMRGGR